MGPVVIEKLGLVIAASIDRGSIKKGGVVVVVVVTTKGPESEVKREFIVEVDAIVKVSAMAVIPQYSPT